MVEERYGGEGSENKIVNDLLKEFEKDIRERIECEANETKKYLLFVAWLNTRLESLGLGRIVVTGSSP